MFVKFVTLCKQKLILVQCRHLLVDGLYSIINGFNKCCWRQLISIIQSKRAMMENQKSTQSGLPWVEKYRPETLGDLISHQGILDTLRKFINDDNLPNLLFYGPPGTGKTSTIKALAKQFYKQDYGKMVLEFNASDERGIDVVRTEIKGFASSKTLSKNNSLKLIILDEADMMTPASQFALRRIIQKYAQNARFCLISNYVSRVIPALQSRCTRFKFKQIPYDSALQRILRICSNQNLNLSEQATKAVFRLCQGDMRRVVNMLQSLSLLNQQGEISQGDIYTFTGNPSPQAMQQYLTILTTDTVTQAFIKLDSQFKENGISMQTVVKQLYPMLMNLKMNASAKKFIINKLADIEYRISIGGQQKLALGSLIGAFYQARQIMSDESM